MPLENGDRAVTDGVRVEGRFFSRGTDRLLIRGVTYGPFDSGVTGAPFPDRARVMQDFALMKQIGVNAL
ncbi:MAG: hypothetical protein WCN98_16675, partial [Verrucomicrobiaceae bacterium]